jgi:signal peptidase I
MMFDKRRKYSYTAQKHQRHRLRKAFLWFASMAILYNLLAAFLVSTWTVENNSMMSGLEPGDRLVFTSFSIPLFLAGKMPDQRSLPFKRGDIVLIDLNYNKKQKLSLSILDGMVRFFTLQRISIFDRDEHLYVKRIIGLEGDEIAMTNYVFKVRPANTRYALTEFEHSGKPYHPVIPQSPELWDESIPFSGSMETMTLGLREFFAVSDNRANTNDSRTWGAVPPDTIRARAVFRYWPLNKIGLPE